MRADHLPITGPCPIHLDPFVDGEGAETHFCGHCDKDVHVLSNMSRAEARTFVREHAGQHLCIAYKVDVAGQIRYADEPAPAARAIDDGTISASSPERDVVPLERLRLRRDRAGSPMLPRAAMALALAACTPHAESTEHSGHGVFESEHQEVGKIEVVDPDAPRPNGDGEVIMAGAAPIMDTPPQPDTVAAGGLEIADTPVVAPNDKPTVSGEVPCDPDKAGDGKESKTVKHGKKPPAHRAGGAKMPPEHLVGDVLVE